MDQNLEDADLSLSRKTIMELCENNKQNLDELKRQKSERE